MTRLEVKSGGGH